MNELPNKELPKYCNNKDTDKSISENEAPSITEIKRGLKNMDLEEQEDADDENGRNFLFMKIFKKIHNFNIIKQK